MDGVAMDKPNFEHSMCLDPWPVLMVISEHFDKRSSIVTITAAPLTFLPTGLPDGTEYRREDTTHQACTTLDSTALERAKTD